VPVEIVWSPLAQAQLQEIRAYVAMDKPQAAERLAIRIVAVVELLKDYPHLGRAGAEPGIRELVIGGSPYVVWYRVQRTSVTINAIWHCARRRETT
jgi:toxin ParE1/3/4